MTVDFICNLPRVDVILIERRLNLLPNAMIAAPERRAAFSHRISEQIGRHLYDGISFSQLKFLYPLKTLVFPAFMPSRFGPFPSFFPLREEMRETFFRLSLQPYPAALRKFAWPLWWRERKCSLWYLHQNVPAAPAHPWVLPREREGWSYMYASTDGNESHPYAPEAIQTIVDYSWPENSSQLYRVVKKLVLQSEDSKISAAAVEEALCEESALVRSEYVSAPPRRHAGRNHSRCRQRRSQGGKHEQDAHGGAVGDWPHDVVENSESLGRRSGSRRRAADAHCWNRAGFAAMRGARTL